MKKRREIQCQLRGSVLKQNMSAADLKGQSQDTDMTTFASTTTNRSYLIRYSVRVSLN